MSGNNNPREMKRKAIIGSQARQNVINVYNGRKECYAREGVTKSRTELIAEVAGLFKYGVTTVMGILKNYEAGLPVVTPNKRRKRRRPVRDLVDEFSKEAIARYIHENALQGKVLSGKEIWQHVKNNYETYFFNGSYPSFYRILKEMGFVWSKGSKNRHIMESDAVIVKRGYFLTDYMKNKNSENPQPVVYLDETWIYMHGATTYSWNMPGTSTGIVRRPPEGRRLVVVHAGTRGGFVPGASLIFATDLKTGQDYHGAMNSSVFESWLTKQLIPGIRSLGPSIIVMDNASYHSRQVEKRPTMNWRRQELITWLTQKGVRVPANANKVMLTALAKQNIGHLKRYAVDEMLSAEGHTVLRLPPYYSIFNPIENVWSVAKGYFDKNVNARPGQGAERAKAVWQEALNQVTPEKWNNAVDHAEKIMAGYYDNEVIFDNNEEVIIDLSSASATDTAEEDTEEDEPLTIEPIAGPSHIQLFQPEI